MEGKGLVSLSKSVKFDLGIVNSVISDANSVEESELARKIVHGWDEGIMTHGC